MTIEITEKKLKAVIQIAFAECGLEDENLENLIIRYTKGLSVFGVKQLSANEGKICTPSMEGILNEAQRRKAKYSVQYADYSLDTWTVASDLLEHRKINLLADGSVRKVRIEYEM